MILELGINRVAKQVSSQDFRDGLRNLKELANQANAEDKYGSFTASVQIFLLAITISGILYSFTLRAFPNRLKEYLQGENFRYKMRNTSEQKGPSEKDIFDMIMDVIQYGSMIGGVTGGSILYIRKKNKAARQRAMEQAMQEEMDRLKEHLEQ